MSRNAVLLVEDDPDEQTLVGTALALHVPEVALLAAPDARAALERHGDGAGVGLAILGVHALDEEGAALVRALDARGVPTVAVSPRLSPADRRRAEVAGVKAIYERPDEWPSYRDFIGSILERWLAA